MLPSYLNIDDIDTIIHQSLAEDVGAGDVSTLATIAPETEAEARFLAKADGVLAGCVVAERVFAIVDPEVRLAWTAQDGDFLTKGTYFGTVQGKARSLLVGERLALNLMQRMSGIATATHLMVEAVKPYHAQILDTRKTVPCLRLLDKWGVKIGGGTNHRIGLFDMVMIKDNHITAAGSITKAVEAAQHYLAANNIHVPIEVETRTLAEVEEALAIGGVDRIMLDNMTKILPDGMFDVSMLQQAVARINGRFATEASGNVTLERVNQIASTGVDYISSGALTHSVIALDISLKIRLLV